MILILAAIAIVALVGVALLLFGNEGYDGWHTSSIICGVLLLVAAGISGVAFAASAYEWFAAEHKAKIINREYDTDYTQAEVFWASDVIDTVRELDRKRIEVNGDVMRDTPDEKR